VSTLLRFPPWLSYARKGSRRRPTKCCEHSSVHGCGYQRAALLPKPTHRSVTFLARPKSVSLILPLISNSRFSGLRSLYTTPLLCT
jgi:hypothetical protein